VNVSELKAEIARVGATYRGIAVELGISEQALYNKLNKKTEFKGSEIKKLASMLSLTMDKVNYIFFGGEVNIIHQEGA